MSPIPLPEAASFPFATPHALLGLSEVLCDVRLSTVAAGTPCQLVRVRVCPVPPYPVPPSLTVRYATPESEDRKGFGVCPPSWGAWVHFHVENEQHEVAWSRALLINLLVRFQNVTLSVALVNGAARFRALATLVGVITPQAVSSLQQW